MPELIEIDDYKAPELDVFTRLDEPQLRHYYEPDGGLFLAESLRVIELALDAGYRPAAMLLEDKTAKSQAADVLARVGDIPVYTASKEVMNQIPGFNITRGALCAMHRPPDRTAQEVLRAHGYFHGKRRRDYPVGRGTWHRRRAADARLQRSAVQTGTAREHGDVFADSLGVSGQPQRGLAGGRHGASA